MISYSRFKTSVLVCALGCVLLLLACGQQIPPAGQPEETPPALAIELSPDAATLVLVRHAERAGGSEDDPLTEYGHQRAQTLAELLGELEIHQIFSSEKLRAQQTAEPLASTLGLTPVVIAKGNVEALTEAVRKTPPGTASAVFSHADDLPVLAERLGGGIEPYGDQEYDRLVILTLRDGEATGTQIKRFQP